MTGCAGGKFKLADEFKYEHSDSDYNRQQDIYDCSDLKLSTKPFWFLCII